VAPLDPIVSFFLFFFSLVVATHLCLLINLLLEGKHRCLVAQKKRRRTAFES